MARQYLLPHQINDDDWYTLSGVTYQVTSQSSRRPLSSAPYPNYVVHSGMQIKRLHLPVWREVRDPVKATTPDPRRDTTYPGHLADGSSVQKHSAGGLYPYVIFAQETVRGLEYGVIGPKKPNGMLIGSYDQAVQFAVGMKGGAV